MEDQKKEGWHRPAAAVTGYRGGLFELFRFCLYGVWSVASGCLTCGGRAGCVRDPFGDARPGGDGNVVHCNGGIVFRV